MLRGVKVFLKIVVQLASISMDCTSTDPIKHNQKYLKKFTKFQKAKLEFTEDQ